MNFTPTDWIYYKQPIKFLVFVAGTCNMIFLLVSNGNLTLVFLNQVVAINPFTARGLPFDE